MFQHVRAATEALAAPLSAEDCMIQSMSMASPVKWHLGHTSWFFDNFVLPAHDPGHRSPLAHGDRIFNSYYETVGTPLDRPLRALLSRPSADEVQDYRRRIDDAVMQALQSDPSEEVCELALLGVNHEEQHQELILTDIKHAFWLQPLRPAYRPDRAVAAVDDRGAPAFAWQRFAGGVHWTGCGADGFAFDNERPRHQMAMNDFALASRLVTVGEYLTFMRDGGYDRPELWLSDGWAAVRAQRWSAPLYWEATADGWTEHTLGGTRSIDPAAPVAHVSFYEADAFARWAGHRLPRESEWEQAAQGSSVAGNLLESGRLRPAPAEGAAAMTQLFGDVWEWTASPYTAYPGYRQAGGALGEYNGKFMCNQLVLRGGSCVTPTRHLRPSYRNFFPPDARWQFSGIRLAKDM